MRSVETHKPAAATATLRDVAAARRRAPRHRLARAEPGDPRARQRGDGPARARGGRGARLPPEPDRARPEDEPLVHDRRASSRTCATRCSRRSRAGSRTGSSGPATRRCSPTPTTTRSASALSFEALRARQVDGVHHRHRRGASTRCSHELAANGLPLVLVNRRLDDGEPAVGDRRRPRRHAPGRRAPRRARPPPDRPPRRPVRSSRPACTARRASSRGCGAPGSRSTRSCRDGIAAFTEAEGARLCRELLDGGAGFTAILAGNDLMALGCYRRARDAGLRLPARRLRRRLQRHASGASASPRRSRRSGSRTTRSASAAADLLLERLARPARAGPPRRPAASS